MKPQPKTTAPAAATSPRLAKVTDKKRAPYLFTLFKRYLHEQGIKYQYQGEKSDATITTQAHKVFPQTKFRFYLDEFGRARVTVQPIPLNGLSADLPAKSVDELLKKLARYKFLQQVHINLMNY